MASSERRKSNCSSDSVSVSLTNSSELDQVDDLPRTNNHDNGRIPGESICLKRTKTQGYKK